jgi:hypothetical protein
LSIFNFSTRFFAQIVENRETQLSSPFLSPGDNFSKSYDENQIYLKRQGYVAAARGSDAQIRIYNTNLNKSDQIWFLS